MDIQEDATNGALNYKQDSDLDNAVVNFRKH